MALTLTQYTTGTWVSADEQLNSKLIAARKIKIAEMVSDNKTDGISYPQSPTVTIRDWVDTSAAQEFIDWSLAECASLGIASPTFTITPINS
jgi:hypothetical protein